MNLIKNFKFKPYLKNLEVHMVIGTTGKFWPFKPIGLNGPRFSYTKSFL